MKQKIILFVLVLLLGYGYKVSAQTYYVMECDYTDEYKEWLSLSNKDKKEYLEPTKCKTNNLGKSMNVGVSLGNIDSSKFDLRELGKVTSVKDQGNSGSCWAFATLAAIESSALIKGIGTFDLSEAHMELSTQNTLFESILRYNRRFATGGTYLMADAYLFNRVGVTSEEDYPYSLVTDAVRNNSTSVTKENLKNRNLLFSVNSSSIASFSKSGSSSCSTESTVESIKNLLVTKGALAAKIHWAFTDDIRFDNTTMKDKYIDGKYYYYDGSSYKEDNITISSNLSNHAVTIVGWDDTVTVDKFTISPSKPGAWIVKNSYGTKYTSGNMDFDMGDGGYYYVSYDDYNICSELHNFYDLDTKLEDNVYYADELGVNDGIGSNNADEIYAANVFETKSEKEKLKKISFYSWENNLKYSVYYSNNSSITDLKQLSSGVIDHIGYTTINVNDVIIDSPKFSIVVKYEKNGDDTQAIVPVYSKIGGDYQLDVNENISYMSADGVNWIDMAKLEGRESQFTVKAYTDNYSSETSDNISSNEPNSSTDEQNNDTNDSDSGTDEPSNNVSDSDSGTDEPSNNVSDSDSSTDETSNDTNDSDSSTDEPSNDKKDKFVFVDNPNNEYAGEIISNDEEDIYNPKTGSSYIIVIITLLLISGSLVLISINKSGKNKI